LPPSHGSINKNAAQLAPSAIALNPTHPDQTIMHVNYAPFDVPYQLIWQQEIHKGEIFIFGQVTCDRMARS
jgi:hypothetical protein